MPKAPSSSAVPSTSSSSTPYAPSNGSHPNVLKRNQACHQCRRRKLKCDAKRPCSTCVRSHAHAVAHAPAGNKPPPNLECTFDEIAETNVTVNDGPKSRYEKLENRISELEALLSQKESAEQIQSGLLHMVDTSPKSPGSVFKSSETELQPNSNSPSFSSSPMEQLGPYQTSSSGNHSFTQFLHGNVLDTVSGIGDALEKSSISYSSTGVSPGSVVAAAPVAKLSPNIGLDIFWPNWPSELPHSALLRHLVEVFFVFHPHATRLFHASSFLASLSLPPHHHKFPVVPVLHAICAIGSLYTAAVSSPPLPDFNKIQPDEIFPRKYRLQESRPDSFAEQQAQYAKETAEHYEILGESLLQVLQARIILSWFFWSHSRWADVFIESARSLRLAVPLGLNVCPPFHSITKSQRPPSILLPARTVIEDETRRNIFWLAYAMERQHGSGNGWALTLDDQDISQMMPLRGDQFEEGILVTPCERQWAQSKDLLLEHPDSQSDSFIIYIKGSILMSRVKVFNHRFRARHFAGDPSVASPRTANIASDDNIASEAVDPRGSPAFIELDQTISSFRASFPSHLRTPISENVVDSHLYTACLIPYAATIVLHDPHADVQRSGCISALKILTAARGILDLIYNVSSTSYDITLLDSFCSFCWFSAGRVLVRFLQAAIAANAPDQVTTLRTELEFIRSAISKVGERIPLAYRFAKMLEDLTIKACGPTSTQTSGLEMSVTSSLGMRTSVAASESGLNWD